MVEARPSKSHYGKNASGRACYAVFDAEVDFLTDLSKVLEGLGFAEYRPPIVGFDEVYLDFKNGDVRLTIGWDHWSSCFVFAWEPEGDPFVIEAGRQIDLLVEEINARR